MTFEDFQHLARRYVVGALDDDEMEQFRAGRKQFGARAEAFINDSRKLNSIFALSLQPRNPHPDTKQKLLDKIRMAAVNNENVQKPEIERGGSSSGGTPSRFSMIRRGGLSRI
jgi:hypothetical protein